MSQGKSGSNFLEGLLFGGLLGAAAALLLAPSTGDEARLKVHSKVKELGFEGMIDRLSEAFDEGKKEAHKVLAEEEK
ncbi:hypothetical protein A2291_05120 [candidate division WOR-1 bacterium RIFOXYB2_FULL_42_35]|uniref:YtxH domain-containing protein n=1 Tax=candidate division WOR-1 bacterium RIFOXYC2_FULL_41_25 TaxID=1802586 RepID=A0A1F4TN17_UNCSA|nr:MAG: hypothetical protein A2247_00540 [candidate division WOR-1 bacterium RIFOXYA2_FULL_41_14]OGC24481.1 MAG: hypothetical protein A2291_05120 [candidate division WOR-1 bacterium RIFOXYB2_FULL_42_35]OGC34098.1 MAG: hypothetical protein A2462_00980 [candidate division WOR-1 bacterium RIFOXYC2_FULL_41_25]OGC42794.1 MAG: hypothetical protein A2548_00595 [candidate division WOR-1 bacterium RIFOXYD2_FULL_41_8]